MIGSIERKERGSTIDARLEVHWARPETVEVAQRVLGMIEPQVYAEVFVLEVHLAAIAVVAVLHPDDRLPEIGQVEQQPLLDLLELTALDLVHLALVVVPVAEHLVAAAEVRGQE